MIPVSSSRNAYGYTYIEIDWGNTLLYNRSATQRASALMVVAKQLGYKAAYTASKPEEYSALLLQVKARLKLADMGHVQDYETPK